MPKIITLTGVHIHGLTVVVKPDGNLQVETSYVIVSDGEPILPRSRDVTALLPPSNIVALGALLNRLRRDIEAVELTP